MTKANGNGPITVVSNPAVIDRTETLRGALNGVADDLVRWHPGAFGVMQGWARGGVGRLSEPHQDALHALEHDGLIAKGLPPEGHPSAGNPVWITGMGWPLLAKMNAAAGVVSAA